MWSPEAQLSVLESRIQTLRLQPGSSGARWPLKLHRVLLAPAPTWQETLAVAMEGSGLIHGGLEALFQMGQSFQDRCACKQTKVQ
ncbi:unnamed protein product [Effrenium voratum]|nr:unnamed protein product [Effrenium voratum]